MKLFCSYGLFVNHEQLLIKCPLAKIYGIGFIKDYSLRFRSFATVEKRDNYAVPVVIWEISDADEKQLDLVEGVAQNFYYKDMIKVNLIDGSEVDCLIYILKRAMEPNVPNLWYANKIKEGYIENNLPLKYLVSAFYEFIIDGRNRFLKPFLSELESLATASEDIVPAELKDTVEPLDGDLTEVHENSLSNMVTELQADSSGHIESDELSTPSGVVDSTQTNTSDSVENPGLDKEIVEKPEVKANSSSSSKSKNKSSKPSSKTKK